MWDDACCRARIGSTERGISEMDCSSTCDVRVTAGGDQVAAHGGLFVLGRFADGLGLGEALSAVLPPSGERAPSHDRGKVLVHVLLMLAGGGEACSDIEASAGPAGAVRAGGVGLDAVSAAAGSGP